MISPIIAILGALAGSAAAAQQPAALVLDVTGTVTPALAPFDEAPAGALLRLAEDAEVTLLHYGRCVETRVRGGMLVVAPDGLRVGRGGEVLAETAQPCPAGVSLQPGDAALGAVILRGGLDPVARLAPRPEIVVVGPRRGGVSRIEIESEGGATVTLDFDGARARLPQGARALDPALNHLLVAHGADGGRTQVAARVEARAGLTLIAP